jgi:hypothetical protein
MEEGGDTEAKKKHPERKKFANKQKAANTKRNALLDERKRARRRRE